MLNEIVWPKWFAVVSSRATFYHTVNFTVAAFINMMPDSFSRASTIFLTNSFTTVFTNLLRTMRAEKLGM